MKKFVIFICLLFLIAPVVCHGQEAASQETFIAKVVEILEEREITRQDGSTSLQQNIKLKGLENEWQNKEVIYQGIDEIDVISKNIYKKGDQVIVLYSQDVEGNDHFYITDYVRSGKIWLLLIIFALLIIFIAHWKGFKSLISLFLTFGIILWLIVPQILTGKSPLLISIVGCFIILLLILYITEGFNQKSHICVVSILISLILTGLLAMLFTYLTRLTGTAQEEAMYLIGIGKSAINMKGLLLAGILIGALGVLDDVVISQVAAVEEIKLANPKLPIFDVFRRAMKIGTSHIGSMTNTLFLAYAGASMPLLLIFCVKQEPFLTFSQVINNEMIATEIVRAVVGSIGLALAVPIATALAAYYLKVKES